MRKLNVVEIYAGTARSTQPFLSWKRVASPLLIDSNPYAAQAYRHNFPKANYLVNDVSKITGSDIVRAVSGKVDILLGCPPCQGFSEAGARDANDPRNAHVIRFGHLVNQLKPLAVGMENVPLLANSWQFNSFVKIVERAGYSWTSAIANAALWGSCQSRQRLIFIALRKDLKIDPQFPEPTHGMKGKYFSYRFKKLCHIKEDLIGMLGQSPGGLRAGANALSAHRRKFGPKSIPTVAEVIGDLPRIGTPKAEEMDHFPWNHGKEILKKMGAVKEGGQIELNGRYFSQAYGRLHRKGLARTITCYFSNAGSGRFWHPMQNRALSLREAARIQGFPDSFRFLEKSFQNCVLVGNALDGSLSNLTYLKIRDYIE
jgi:DNA (cytosine-5)-methyltransferase 1